MVDPNLNLLAFFIEVFNQVDKSAYPLTNVSCRHVKIILASLCIIKIVCSCNFVLIKVFRRYIPAHFVYLDLSIHISIQIALCSAALHSSY